MSAILTIHLQVMLPEQIFTDVWSLQSDHRHFPTRLGTYATLGHLYGCMACPDLCQRFSLKIWNLCYMRGHIHTSLVYPDLCQIFSEKIWNLCYMRTHSWIYGLCKVMSVIFPKELELMLHQNKLRDQ